MTEVSLKAMECKQARQALDWSRDDLAREAGVGKRTIIDFENSIRQPKQETMRALRSSLERAGVQFRGADMVVPIILSKESV